MFVLSIVFPQNYKVAHNGNNIILNKNKSR